MLRQIQQILNGGTATSEPSPLPERVEFARARITELLTDELLQSAVDIRAAMDRQQEDGALTALLSDQDRREVGCMVLFGRVSAIDRFIVDLSAEDRQLLRMLPNRISTDKPAFQIPQRRGVPRDYAHLAGSLITLLQEVGAELPPSKLIDRILETGKRKD